MLTFTNTVSIWLTDPANLVTLDPSNSDDFRQRTTMMRADFGADWDDWLKLGTATITYSVDLESEEARTKALQQIEETIRKTHEETRKRLEALNAARQNLLAITYNPQA
jgi:predicted transcriptional regulator